MQNPPIPMIILVNIAVVLFYATILVQSAKWFARRGRPIRGPQRDHVAATMGLTVLHNDVAFPPEARPWLIPRRAQQSVRARMVGSFDGVEVTLADLVTEDSSHLPTHRTIALLRTDTSYPHVSVEPAGWGAHAADRIAATEVTTELEEFNRRFQVNAVESFDVQSVLSQQVMAWMIEPRTYEVGIETGPFGVLAYVEGLLHPEEFRPFLEEAVSMAATIPASVGAPRTPFAFVTPSESWLSSDGRGVGQLGATYLETMSIFDVLRKVFDGSWKNSPATKRYLYFGGGGWLLMWGVVAVSSGWVGFLGILAGSALALGGVWFFMKYSRDDPEHPL